MAEHNKIVIAIDGPAGSGKSTTARRVADYFGYVYVDTGAMYRAVTLQALRSGILPQDKRIDTFLESVSIGLSRDEEGKQHTFVNNEDVTELIRMPNISDNVSYYSSVPSIRAKMVQIQKSFGEQGGIVMDGRDIGTVVFPDADLKIYLIASIDERVKRRVAELNAKGERIHIEDIRRNINERDILDTSREHSPLRKAEDAIEIDTSVMTIEEQTEKIIVLAENIISESE